MKRVGLLVLMMVVLTANPQTGTAGVRGHVFVGGYARSTMFVPGGAVSVVAFQHRIDLSTGAGGPYACVGFIEYACGQLDFNMLPTLHEVRLSGTLATELGAAIEVDVSASSGLTVDGTPVGLGNVSPAVGVCTAVYPACAESLVGGGTNLYTSGAPIGTFRYLNRSGVVESEFRPQFCECVTLMTFGWGAGIALLSPDG